MQLHSNPLTRLVRAALPRAVRNAIRKPSTSLARMMSKWRRWCGEVVEVEVQPDWTVKCHPMCAGEFSVFQTDPEQEPEMRGFIRLATPGMQFIDVGTHWGIFTLAALNYGGPEARVLGIEASDQAAKVLRDNLAINHSTDRVIVINAACGDRVGELKMLTTGAGGADYFVVPAEERPDTVAVPLVSVDHLVVSHSFVPTHLKVDVEGFEEEVLVGARETLSKHRPLLFLELHTNLIRQRGRQPETVLKELISLGYTSWQKLDGSPISAEALAAAAESQAAAGHNLRFVAQHHS